MVAEDVRHCAVSQWLAIVVGIKSVFVILQWSGELHLITELG
jgi:hypothetical protein